MESGQTRMLILGIETSCDETAAAIVENGKKIISNTIASSVDIHTKTGGIIPENAAREQLKAIIPVLQSTFDKARLTPDNIDKIAVTVGPGLIGSLLVGVETAKTLAYVWNKPIIPVNHLIGHIYANWINHNPSFPALALIASGGHTELVLLKSHQKIEKIGNTRDDAAGEAFDKIARLLGLGFPGGPAIAKQAAKIKTKNNKYNAYIHLPRPLIGQKTFDFSFSGLKTAVLREVQKHPPSSFAKTIFAYEVQEAITDVLVNKTIEAVQMYKPKSLLLAGGVAANQRLREKFELEIKNSNLGINFFVPPPNFCPDNAAMIAAAAEFIGKPRDWQKITADPGLAIEDKPT